MYNYLALGPYKGSYRDIAKRVKSLDRDALIQAVPALRRVLPPDAILVPMPSHTGKPEFTAVICKALSLLSRRPVCDCLRCTPHESLRTLKNTEFLQGLPKGNLMPPPGSLGFRLVKDLPAFGTPVVIDNVIASGTTGVAALSLLGEKAVLLVIADDVTFPKRPEMQNGKRKA